MHLRARSVSRAVRLLGFAALVAATAGSFASSAAPGERVHAAAVQKWFGGRSGGLTQTLQRDTGGNPKSRIVLDDKQTYRGELTFKFTIDSSGSISGKGTGKYTAADWSLSGTNGDKGPISCTP